MQPVRDPVKWSPVQPLEKPSGVANNNRLENGLCDGHAYNHIKYQVVVKFVHFIGDGASSASKTVTYVSAAR